MYIYLKRLKYKRLFSLLVTVKYHNPAVYTIFFKSFEKNQVEKLDFEIGLRSGGNFCG